ncbi:hypothetical protein PHLGIDRAFT_97410 [Phlebiopsis gigantea 11061_1 CR5-6]|uniref:N-acetyltransferase domain-containing protein n=1 Tax=Phlebiopsis gigantea (strain 11061_1 CR5-6) TaxID=745531 RepID=A0A0C3P463_PHLG1|nr:hypothetical protein PHLGIDRAFT_97410 [Phlebiopsis gigantea 11061_1 CR5-6]
MDVPAHEIIVVPGVGQPGRDELRQQCYDLRVEVFHREQGFSVEDEFDQYDEAATHVLLRLTPSLTPVGTIRVTRPAGTYYKLTRLVVRKDYRRFRFGRELVEFHREWVRQDARAAGQPEARIHCHSQLYVRPFYAK